MGYRKNPVTLIELRRLAQERLSGQIDPDATVLTLVQAQKLFEELEIHQIELELQNEHLNTTRTQLEMVLNQNNELYDFTPVGCLLLDPVGTITKLNLAAASLLGRERARLLGSRLGLCMPSAERQIFNTLLAQAIKTGDVQSGELSLAEKGLPTRHAQIRIGALPDKLGWHVILIDITERRLVEESLRVSEERWKLALEAAGDGVWDWNVQTGDMTFSSRFEKLFGFGEDEYGHHVEDWRSRVHPEDLPVVMAQTQACLSGKVDSFSNEHRGQCKDGHWKWVLCRGALVSRGPDGRPLRMIGTHVDITSKKQTEEALLVSARFQQAVFDSLSAQIAILDRYGMVIQTNAAWWKYAVDNQLADTPAYHCKNYLEILDYITGHEHDTLQVVSAGLLSVAAGEVANFQLPHPFFTPLDKRWFNLKLTPVHDADERMVVSHEDVTQLKAAELASLTLANVDALTGALSRRHFFNLAEQELTRSNRYEMPLMVLMLDLDHFKLINDQYGHAVGDAVLQGFVKTVTGVLRESDLIGRIGGEEFAVLLPNTTLEGGQALAQRIIENVRASPVEVNHKKIAYTVSIGAGCLTTETAFATLLGLADAALYRAKNSGRDRLEVSPVSPV